MTEETEETKIQLAKRYLSFPFLPEGEFEIHRFGILNIDLQNRSPLTWFTHQTFIDLEEEGFEDLKSEDYAVPIVIFDKDDKEYRTKPCLWSRLLDFIFTNIMKPEEETESKILPRTVQVDSTDDWVNQLCT